MLYREFTEECWSEGERGFHGSLFREREDARIEQGIGVLGDLVVD